MLIFIFILIMIMIMVKACCMKYTVIESLYMNIFVYTFKNYLSLLNAVYHILKHPQVPSDYIPNLERQS